MLTIKADAGQLNDQLSALGKQQLPFAAALALTDTAHLAKTAVTRALPSIFDRPTPFTMNAVSVQRATKRNLEALVFVKERQAAYLAIEETGGTATPKKQAFVMPRAIGVDRYGNMPKGAIKRAIAHKGVFSGQVDGVNGLFFRKEKDKPPVLLALFTKRASYKPTFGFKARVLKVAGATLPVAMKASMAKALATARR